MLSERVILVLSRQYVKETWYVFEKILRQLTQMSLHNQRIMGVLLEDCVIPESLGELYFLDTSDPDFFEVFTKRLKSGMCIMLDASKIFVFLVLPLFSFSAFPDLAPPPPLPAFVPAPEIPATLLLLVVPVPDPALTP